MNNIQPEEEQEIVLVQPQEQQELESAVAQNDVTSTATNPMGTGDTETAAAAEDVTVTVVDPLNRKLEVPLNKIHPTKASQRDGARWGAGVVGTSSLCLLFLEGRCRQGMDCNQTHADPECIKELRLAASNKPMCCQLHGDSNADKFKFFPQWSGFEIAVENTPLPLERLAFTQGLQRSMVNDLTKKVSISPLFVCKLHIGGNCRYGEECKFVHVCRELVSSHLSHAVQGMVEARVPVASKQMQWQQYQQRKNVQQQQQQQFPLHVQPPQQQQYVNAAPQQVQVMSPTPQPMMVQYQQQQLGNPSIPQQLQQLPGGQTMMMAPTPIPGNPPQQVIMMPQQPQQQGVGMMPAPGMVPPGMVIAQSYAPQPQMMPMPQQQQQQQPMYAMSPPQQQINAPGIPQPQVLRVPMPLPGLVSPPQQGLINTTFGSTSSSGSTAGFGASSVASSSASSNGIMAAPPAIQQPTQIHMIQQPNPTAPGMMMQQQQPQLQHPMMFAAQPHVVTLGAMPATVAAQQGANPSVVYVNQHQD